MRSVLVITTSTIANKSTRRQVSDFLPRRLKAPSEGSGGPWCWSLMLVEARCFHCYYQGNQALLNSHLYRWKDSQRNPRVLPGVMLCEQTAVAFSHHVPFLELCINFPGQYLWRRMASTTHCRSTAQCGCLCCSKADGIIIKLRGRISAFSLTGVGWVGEGRGVWCMSKRYWIRSKSGIPVRVICASSTFC